MSEVISTTIKIPCKNLPPKCEFIEEEIDKLGWSAIRWSIIDVKDNELIISLSAIKK